ncbi:MAG: TetR/AcrR family transcriptional regulator, partial [Oscillospiraceae bacterium]
MARPVNEEKRKEKVDLILNSARAVFQKKGFLGVSMKDIIEACGISRGGIYLYFSSVDEVFRAVLARRNAHRFSGVEALAQENMDFFQLLDVYFAQQKKRLMSLENSLLRATYEYLFTHRDSEDAQFQKEEMEHVKRTLLEILHLGVQQKAIRDEHIPQLAENFMYTIEGLSVLALLGGLTEQHVDGQFELMKGTLLLQSALNAPLPARPLRVLVT